ncbi:TfoX/Sxy family protein [Nocardioides sp. HDW12B]|uniref:TfoX/Sxy family protein n=1 Tax=Nocardioides sp. HDW12B TaxID=2714939 RepID=UPI00140CD75E|nr:TfoX/Sxy family protein [Nocardioides sp. HDW12B]QIK67314.1 TfoX/Sxy family protein [Nocardioides sp. HDW12B]
MAYDEALAARVRDELAGEPGSTEKRMFGGLAFLLGGHMAVAVSGAGGLMLRVPPERLDELLAEPGAGPMVMRGREMTGWMRVEADAVTDDEVLARWVGVGRDHVRTLPPKPGAETPPG